MGLLDDDYKPLWKPPKEGKKFRRETALSQQDRDSRLNNDDREEVTEDFSDSPFADRV
jgi:hypothetical protein